MKKILWLCNSVFTDKKIKTTASWLQPLAELLQQSEEVQLYNITLGNVKEIQKNTYQNIVQWIIPQRKLSNHGQVASLETYQYISQIEQEIQPDLVHVWGTESIWCDAYRKGFIKTKTLLDIQGILSLCHIFYYGNLTTKEIIQCIHLKEILMPWRTLFHKKQVFKERGKIETECLKQFSYISYQSDWVKNHLSFINPQTQLHATKILLRKSFYTSIPWQYKQSNSSPIIFTTASGAIPYKGMHILLKSIFLLKNKYPQIKLHIAGQMKIGNRLLDGYSIFLQKLIRKYQLEENIVYLGPIDETQIVKELQQCNVCVIPSFVETYCLAFAESMIVGAPTIASYAGAMPELGDHKKECLFYNPSDFHMCAYYIDKLIQNKELAETLSYNGRQKRLIENDPQTVLKTQLEIYNNILL